MTAANRSVTEQLMDRIAVMVDEHDVTGVQDLVRGQIAINTALEAENGQLRLELAALREFVRKTDIYYGAISETDPAIPSARRHNAIKGFLATRQRLATEFGIDLPGAEGER